MKSTKRTIEKSETKLTINSFDFRQVPYKVLISMEQQRERRDAAYEQFAKLGMEVEWKVPVPISDPRLKQLPKAYKNHPKYASQTCTIIEVLKEAKRRGSESLMLLEDDIVFHPHILWLMPQVVIPNDWKFIYIGGRNCGSRSYVFKGLAKSTFVSDLHAVIIRAAMFDQVEAALVDKNSTSHWADARIGTLHKNHPTYLFRPNLAWQSSHANDSNVGEEYCNYNDDGSVKPGQGD